MSGHRYRAVPRGPRREDEQESTTIATPCNRHHYREFRYGDRVGKAKFVRCSDSDLRSRRTDCTRVFRQTGICECRVSEIARELLRTLFTFVVGRLFDRRLLAAAVADRQVRFSPFAARLRASAQIEPSRLAYLRGDVACRIADRLVCIPTCGLSRDLSFFP